VVELFYIYIWYLITPKNYKTPIMKNKRRVALFIGSVFAIVVFISPYFLYIHLSVSRDLESFESIFGLVEGGHYLRAQIFLYWFFSKFVMLLLLSIWFITNKHKWVYVLIVPIAIYLFQLINVINDGKKYFTDMIEFIHTIPVILLFMGILYFIRYKIGIYIHTTDLKKEMDDIMNRPRKKYGS